MTPATTLVALLTVGATIGVDEQRRPAPQAVPLEPITAIIDAFRTHSVVALGEGLHGNEQGHAFRLSLIRDRPIYEEFFRSVRAVNATLPASRRLRVLLGDPAIDWDEILRGNDDAGRWVRDRDRHAVAVISVFTITAADSTMYEDLHRLAPSVASWPVPSLAIVRGTALDARQLVYRDAVLYLGPPSAMTFSRISPELCADPRYIEMRLGRVPPDQRTRMREELMRECGPGRRDPLR